MALFVDLMVLIFCQGVQMLEKRTPQQNQGEEDVTAFFFGSSPFSENDIKGNNTERPHVNQDFDNGPNW